MEKFEDWRLTSHNDNRGFLRKVYMDSFQSDFRAGIKEIFISESTEGTVRGMHLMTGAKANYRFIHVMVGEVYDVSFDLRKSSKTFFESKVTILSAEEPKTLWIPPGVAHGFQALTKCQILYGSSSEWDINFDGGFSPLDIGWPQKILHLSDRDLGLPKLSELDLDGII